MRLCHAARTLVGPTLLVVLLAACVPAAPPAVPGKPAASVPMSAAAAPAATAAPAAAPAAAPVPATVRVGILSSVGDAAFSIGIEKGLYAEQGILVETVPFDSAV